MKPMEILNRSINKIKNTIHEELNIPPISKQNIIRSVEDAYVDIQNIIPKEEHNGTETIQSDSE